MAGVGGVGGAGGAGSIGVGIGGGTSSCVAPSVSTTRAVQPNGTQAVVPDEGVRVTISAQGQQLAAESLQEGASFSVTSDAGGHHYVAGLDANGFRSPDSASATHNAHGQAYADLNKLDDMIAAALVVMLLEKRTEQEQNILASTLAASQVVQALNAYAAISKL